jgi:hypothetical protein
MFKLTMKSNATTCMAPPFDTNPLTRMWCLVTTFRILVYNLPKYVKLAELAMVQIVGSVEDKRYFFTLAFMKSRLCNMLITHLPLVCTMVLHYVKFSICKMYWTMANNMSLILLWWLSNGKYDKCNYWAYFGIIELCKILYQTLVNSILINNFFCMMLPCFTHLPIYLYANLIHFIGHLC